jgi:16S rRNA G527 N7-methylase RsmG
VRPDVKAVLVEASQKKAVFLREVLSKLGLSERARVVADRFEKVDPPEANCLTCRAIERFVEILPSLAVWSVDVPTLLLFGGESLREPIENTEMLFDMYRVPESERRFLFVVHRP